MVEDNQIFQIFFDTLGLIWYIPFISSSKHSST